MMRVCFVTSSFGEFLSGADRSLLETLDLLQDRGVQCFALLHPRGALRSELIHREIPHRTLPYRPWMAGRESPGWKRLGRIVLNSSLLIPVVHQIRAWECDVIYSNCLIVSTGALAAWITRCPHVWHLRAFGQADFGLRFDFGARPSLWLLDRLSSVCIAVSEAVADRFRDHIEPSKLKVLYDPVRVAASCSVDGPREQKVQGAGLKCVLVGGLYQAKGHRDAIEALAHLNHDGERVFLTVVGGGDPNYRAHLESLVARKNLAHCVRFEGYVRDALPYMEAADVVLVCSRCEAFGRVTVEAMKVAKPVVGARSGGTAELVRDGFNGLLYTPGDSRELAEKIRYLGVNPAAAHRLGDNGRRWAVRRFTDDQYAQELITILESVADRGVSSNTIR